MLLVTAISTFSLTKPNVMTVLLEYILLILIITVAIYRKSLGGAAYSWAYTILYIYLA